MSEFSQLLCPKCGPQDISDEAYEKQLMQADVYWLCPKCGGYADWIDQDDMEDDYDYAAF